MSAASAITAVPCWSSWKIGISDFSLSLRSISKHLGAAISSRFIPPKLPASSSTVFTIVSTSFERIQSGIASISPYSLNSRHFPSITGIPASGPISPRPKTALPSVTTATVFQRRVSSYDLLTSSLIARQGSATPGVYASESASAVSALTFAFMEILPFHS